MSEPTRDPSGEPGPGATHQRPVPAAGDREDGREDGREDEPRGTDDGRPIDVAPETGPFEMGPAEAGAADDD